MTLTRYFGFRTSFREFKQRTKQGNCEFQVTGLIPESEVCRLATNLFPYRTENRETFLLCFPKNPTLFFPLFRQQIVSSGTSFRRETEKLGPAANALPRLSFQRETEKPRLRILINVI